MELIFFIIAFLAIASAMLMLMSDNAVHSALALVLNFACVAFLYLMLNAAFLAMVQVAVYAGAIMVLFMFVIMLLGSEKVQPEAQTRFPWLIPAAIGLTLLLMLTAGIGILQADISAEDPEPLPPVVRVLNALPNYEAVTVLLNGEPLAEELAFHESSDLSEWGEGEYEVEVLALDEEETLLSVVWLNYVDEANPEVSPSADLSLESSEPTFELLPNTDLTLVLTPFENGVAIIPAYQNLNSVERDKTAHLQVVHALAGVERVDIANITEADRRPVMIFEDLQFAQVSDLHIKRDSETDYGVFAAGLLAQSDANANELDALLRFEAATFEANSSTLFVLAPPVNSDLPNQAPELIALVTANRARFGSPESVGLALFTSYMLPFQVIALLLLVAMMGAIVLTRDQVEAPRKRFQRRLANMGESLTGE